MLRDARPSDEHVSPHGRVMEVLSEHNCQGWLEGYLLTGRHGLFATYEAFAMVSASMAIQHAKWLQHGARAGVARAGRVAQRAADLDLLAQRQQRLQPPGAGPDRHDDLDERHVVRVYLPPDANCLLWTADHCLRSRDYVNLVVIDKQPELQYLDIEAAREHCARGAGEWEWAGNAIGREESDVVLACIGDVPTQETIAAAALLREHVPELRFRVVNVVDLMAIAPADVHPHGMSRERFEALFGETTDVVCAFHGYARALHQLLHGRPNAGRFHVHGYSEQGTTTTPFDMVVLNEMSRYHLVLDALRRARRLAPGARALEQHCEAMLAAPPRLHPRAPRGHARGARLDLAAAGAPDGRAACASSSSTPARAASSTRSSTPPARRSCARGEQRWDPDADAGAPCRGAARGARPSAGGAGARRSATASCTAGRASTGRRAIDDDGARGDRRARAAGAAAHARRAGGHRRRRRGAARRAAGRVLRHGVSPHAAGGGRDVRAAARVERALRAAPLRLSRSQRRVVRTSRPARILGAARCRRLVVCHLGSGCSVSAVLDGRSVDTTMGFTPLEGVPMATRSGSIDPGLLLHLLAAASRASELDEALNHRSGLLGICGLAGLREVEQRRERRRRARAARLDVFVRGVSGAVAAMTTSLRGLDALVFSAGAGEHSALLRGARLRAPRPARRRARRRRATRGTPSGSTPAARRSPCSSCPPARRSSSRARRRGCCGARL